VHINIHAVFNTQRVFVYSLNAYNNCRWFNDQHRFVS